MSTVENYREFMNHRWLCVYGASVAIQANERMHGGEMLTADAMREIKEEAATVANLDAEGESP